MITASSRRRSRAHSESTSGLSRPLRPEARAGFFDPSIELGHRLADRIAAPFVRRRRQLTFELGAREPEAFHRAHRFRIANVFHLRLRALALQFFHALLNARVLIDQSFAGITHMITLSE